jgi:serine protease
MGADPGRSPSKRALELLRTPGTAGLEGLEAAGAAPDLSESRRRSSLQAARERFAKIAERSPGRSGALTPEQEQVLADAEAALRKLGAEGDAAEVTDREMIGLEAIVVPDGTRPSLFVRDDDVDPSVAEAGTWQGPISLMRTAIGQVAPSVGRINSAVGFPHYLGTGFVVADGLIATNRHVLEALTGTSEPGADGTWAFKKPVTIDFAAEFGKDRKREFRVTGVAYAGPDPIKNKLRPANLDLALLKVDTSNGGDSLPPPLPLSRKLKALQQKSDIYVMGYPARPQGEAGEVLMRVFQDEYFVKRFAPGFVQDDPDTAEDEGHHRVFTHDASTLGGNSGSCVVEFRLEGRAVVGLHFGGRPRDHNYAHAIARLESVLAEHGVGLQDV